jgi:hypothetical protein
MSLHFAYKLTERRHGSEYDKFKIYGFDFQTNYMFITKGSVIMDSRLKIWIRHYRLQSEDLDPSRRVRIWILDSGFVDTDDQQL